METNSEFVEFKSPKRKRPGPWLWIALGTGGALVLALAAWLIVDSILPTEQMKQDAFAEACHEEVLDQLRDPDSAHLESESGVIYSEDKDQYSILGEGRARNGFGGMNNFIWGCTGTVDEDGVPDVEADTMS